MTAPTSTLPIEDTAARLAQLAKVAGLGRLTARLNPGSENPGRGSTLARIYITTEKARPADVGGGVVSWAGYVDSGANSDEIDSLNALLALVCEVISDVGLIAAQVRNAFADKRAADRAREVAEVRLNRTLTGRNFAHGEIFVRAGEDGSAWLMDPIKRDAGWGIRYESLSDLWREHPELRPVRWGLDERGPVLIVAPLAMAAVKP